MRLHLVSAVNALIAEALARSGATREDIRQERTRRRVPFAYGVSSCGLVKWQ